MKTITSGACLALASALALGTGVPANSADVQTMSNPSGSAATPAAVPSATQNTATANTATAGARPGTHGDGGQIRRAGWAAQDCIARRDNTATGAVVGGALGAVLGSTIAGRGAHVAGAVAGGAVGAAAGAAVGASSTGGCPPGYVLAAAPAYPYWAPYPPPVVYGPGWYGPWPAVWAYGPRPYWAYGPYWAPAWRWRAGPVYHW